MRKDAVVLEIRKKTAIVLASDGRFLRVRNQNYQVGQRIPESEQMPIRLRPVIRRTLLIAACLVLAIGSSALAASKYMVWSYAGVDVGDISVNYTLNFRDEVLNVEGNSAEAEQLIGSLEKIPYEPVDSAVERMMDAVGEKQTEESEEPEIVVSVASFLGGTGRTEDRIMEGIDRSVKKDHPDESGENRQEDVRVERLEWQDAGQFMDDRHHPQNTQSPADPEGEARLPEELKPETTDNPSVNQPTDAPENILAVPENTPEVPVNTDGKPVQSEKQPAVQPAETSGNIPAEQVKTEGQPVQKSTESPIREPDNPVPDQQEPQSNQTNPATENSPGQQAADSLYENDAQEQSDPGDMQESREPGERNQNRSVQPQSQQPQQAPGSDNNQMNPGGQNNPVNGGNPPDKR